MSNEETTNAESDTPKRRFYELFRIIISSVIISLLLAGISTSALKLWNRFQRQDVVKVWQVHEPEYHRITTALSNSKERLTHLKELLDNNVDAMRLIKSVQMDIDAAETLLINSKFIEKIEPPSVSLGIISAAHADVGEGAKTQNQDNLIIYILLGLVGFVLILFSVIYAFSKDKSQRAFLEKTITTIIGFALGMITGSGTARLK